MTKFEISGSVLTLKSSKRKRSGRTGEQLVLLQDSVTVGPEQSICQRSQQLDIPTNSLHRSLHKDLHMHAYKIQLVQNLKLLKTAP